MSSDNYNHPSFITRQMDNLGKTTAGASGTSCLTAYPTAMRLHRIGVVVTAAGTSTGVSLNAYALSGTTTTTAMATALALSSATATAGYSVVTSDLNFAIPAGATFFTVGGTDATAVQNVTLEMTLDPTTASW